MKYLLSIRPLSYLLVGSGEGSVLVDSDVVFHPSGFPYIPARRIKGILRESMMEVIEMLGCDDQEGEDFIKCFFGVEGAQAPTGLLSFGNAYISPWKQIKENLIDSGLCPHHIQAYLTQEIQQTALGEGGVAKKRSLRNYRTIKPLENVFFEAEISCAGELDEKKLDLLQKAVLNFRYLGTRRNRGFGHVKCSLEKSADSAMAEEDLSFGISYKVTLKTLSPVVLSRQDGDVNAINTYKYVPGSQLRGALASYLMNKKGLSVEDAHTNSVFYDLFLSGKLRFNNLFYEGVAPLPFHFHRIKGEEEASPLSIFCEHKNLKGKNTRAIKGFHRLIKREIDETSMMPESVFFFHNSRPNRAAGRSTSRDTTQGIFYYEAIDEGQQFKGFIEGEEKVMSVFAQEFPSKFEIKLGRSRSAQYGSVEVEIEPMQTETEKVSSPQNLYTLELQSPLALLNDNGFPELSLSLLQRELTDLLGTNIAVKKAATSTKWVESFNAAWFAKSGKFLAWEEGSSFLIESTQSLPKIISIGRFADRGMGRGLIRKFDLNAAYSWKESSVMEEQGKPLRETGLDILDEIVKEARKAEEHNKIRTEAVDAALNLRGTRRLNNHQIGRLEMMFHQVKNQVEVENWLRNVKNKPLGEALMKAKLLLSRYEDRVVFRYPTEDSGSWENEQLYWITFFQTLRKLNKQRK